MIALSLCHCRAYTIVPGTDVKDTQIRHQLPKIDDLNDHHSYSTTVRQLFNLFEELLLDSSDSNDVEGMIGEPAFPEVVEDASDIPVDVVKRYIASGSVDDGFLVAVDGGLLRTSAAEDVEFGLMAHIFVGERIIEKPHCDYAILNLLHHATWSLKR
ncbi:hypothetical protein BYT27DRAFT_7252765 [Phlegmacium glaucopus]|nr:hypothetical protein BYT27DRAFT_7252765 [Phlegmacium glaucopus]